MPAVLQYLLVSGCDPNILSEQQGVASPLHFAVSGGNKDCVQLLLDAGAKVNSAMVTEEVSRCTVHVQKWGIQFRNSSHAHLPCTCTMYVYT